MTDCWAIWLKGHGSALQAEDEIVFPALEAKEKLSNVSHAYTLDHQHENELFSEVEQVREHARLFKTQQGNIHALLEFLTQMSRKMDPRCVHAMSSASDVLTCLRLLVTRRRGWYVQVFGKIRGSKELRELRGLAGQLQRATAAMRAMLHQHVAAEEQELWPLFAEHFSVAEQEDIVGMIIGRTGAEVMQAMLPWVAGAMLFELRTAFLVSV